MDKRAPRNLSEVIAVAAIFGLKLLQLQFGGVVVREHIFTEKERRAIIRFLKTRKRDETANSVAFRLDRCWQVLLLDVKLLLKLKKVLNAGY